MNLDLSKLPAILNRYPRHESSLIMVLQDVQEEYRYLPAPILIQIANELGLPQARIFGVATFFKAFSLTPRGKKVIQVCTGTACHVRGSKLLLEKFERDIGIKSGETSSNLEYTLEGVNCVGACALGPVVVLNDQMLGHFTLGKVDKLLERPKK
jgi:NADH:ubiquinone oxidoreductase subunit E